MTSVTIYNDHFLGNRISEYGLEEGYVDYWTLARSFEHVLNNQIMEKTADIGYWEQEHGFIDNTEEIDELQEQIDELQDQITETEDTTALDELQKQIDELQNQIMELEEEQDYYPECYQYYIISDPGADILKRYTNEIIWYNEELDMYVWGVCHWGTSWDYVLTDIRIERREVC